MSSRHCISIRDWLLNFRGGKMKVNLKSCLALDYLFLHFLEQVNNMEKFIHILTIQLVFKGRNNLLLHCTTQKLMNILSCLF
jgi:hypothetical protein